MFKNKLALAVATLVTFVSSSALAQDAAAAANEFDTKGWAALASGIAMGLAVLGGALGQGRAAAAALEGISRNPGAASKIQTPMIIALAARRVVGPLRLRHRVHASGQGHPRRLNVAESVRRPDPRSRPARRSPAG
jgi:F-type H+-transporting ATPase subunit c